MALLLGLFALIRRRHMLVWALMVLFFGLAALGPSPGLSLAAPAPTADASEWWRYLFPGKWLLGAGLWEYFRFPARMAIMAAVALGILAGAGFDGLRKLGKAGRWAALALAAALLVEALLVTGRPLPKPTQPLRLPWALEPLAADKLPGGVLHANTPLPHRAGPRTPAGTRRPDRAWADRARTPRCRRSPWGRLIRGRSGSGPWAPPDTGQASNGPDRRTPRPPSRAQAGGRFASSGSGRVPKEQGDDDVSDQGKHPQQQGEAGQV